MTSASFKPWEQPKAITIRWAVAPGNSRRGHLDRRRAGEISIHKLPSGKWAVYFFGTPQSTDLVNLEEAKHFAEKNISTWLAERQQSASEYAARVRREAEELKARQERLSQVAARLRDLGVRVRSEPIYAAVVLDVQAAEELAATLTDLKRIEERGAV